MNFRAIGAIYLFEMGRTWRTLLQSIVSPVVSTSLYFVVFGAAIGSRITQVEGVSYGTFIVPGLVMLSVLTQSITNASFGIYFPKFVGTIYWNGVSEDGKRDCKRWERASNLRIAGNHGTKPRENHFIILDHSFRRDFLLFVRS